MFPLKLMMHLWERNCTLYYFLSSPLSSTPLQAPQRTRTETSSLRTSPVCVAASALTTSCKTRRHHPPSPPGACRQYKQASVIIWEKPLRIRFTIAVNSPRTNEDGGWIYIVLAVICPWRTTLKAQPICIAYFQSYKKISDINSATKPIINKHHWICKSEHLQHSPHLTHPTTRGEAGGLPHNLTSQEYV